MKLGLDIGNSRVKGALLTDKNKVSDEIGFPSAINRVQGEKYLNFPQAEDFYVQVVESPLEHFDDIVAVGDKAMEIPNYQEFDVSSTSFKTNQPITTSLLFGAIAKDIKNEKSVKYKLAVSIPIVEAQALGLMKEYREKLTGKHVIKIYRESGAKEVEINIENVMVSNEGQAGFFGLLDMVDKPFRKAMDTVYTSIGEDEDPIGTLDDFLVCDIGEGTSDISVFRNKKFNPEYSFSVTQGIGNVLEDAMSMAKREKLTIESRKKLQAVLSSTNKRQQKRRDQWDQYVQPQENEFIDMLVNTILKAYGNDDYFDAIIFFGGGFSALTGYQVDGDKVVIPHDRLFTVLNERLAELNKTADIVFGIPQPYSQTINERGLTQFLTNM